MIGHGGGGNAVKMLKNPVGIYQFAMTCIRALVMSAYKVMYCLISQTNICCGYNETVLLSTKL